MFFEKILPKKTIIVLSVILLFLGSFIFYTYNPSYNSFFPKCPFYFITGFKCPGCGSQRALHQLLHLNIGKAFHYNAMFVISIPLVIFLTIADILKTKYKKLYLISRNPILSWTIFFIICLWWIFRNTFGL